MEQTIATKNIKFVAYLRLQKIFPAKTVKQQRGKAEYQFVMPEIKWNELKAEFDRSDFLTYAQCLDAVVDLAY